MTIISKKYKLIHFHNPKCGGTSFEVALSKYLGDDDIISIEYEHYRKKMGYKTARNHLGDGYEFKIRQDFFKRILINIRNIFINSLRLNIVFKNYVPYYYPIFFIKIFWLEDKTRQMKSKTCFQKNSKNTKKFV